MHEIVVPCRNHDLVLARQVFAGEMKRVGLKPAHLVGTSDEGDVIAKTVDSRHQLGVIAAVYAKGHLGIEKDGARHISPHFREDFCLFPCSQNRQIVHRQHDDGPGRQLSAATKNSVPIEVRNDVAKAQPRQAQRQAQQQRYSDR
ncbi:hypothetical protein FHW97_002376 [Novosphingobium sp. SG754]|uniref:hypothetical protein n=2 Tax=Novosphingobium TaxID=165696 RepID=UPI001611693E|nr:hypothetical protein [Novosphingobium sp. BK626]MBB3478241.1 hypothetical protein [Novosphingobium sp. BK369]MBB3621325.1 hypothetical protein [Novosphingobium sp. BK592]NOX05882.1 hypothetical protein [Novosphingobium sp. SG754]